MSIISALQDYLIQFDGMALRSISEVLTDRPDCVISRYAIAPAGNSCSGTDVTGRRIYRNSYVFYAEERTDAEADRAETWDFLEMFTAWMENQAERGNYPKLPENYVVENLEVSNAMLVEVNDKSGNGIYQVQIQLEISKE